MRKVVEQVPLPLCGVILAVSSTGILLRDTAPWAYPVFGIIAYLLLALFVAKVAMFPRKVLEDMKNPVLAGVSATLPMSLLSMSTYLQVFSLKLSFALWLFAICLYAVLIAYYAKTFLLRKPMEHICPTTFVMTIGPVLAIIMGTEYETPLFDTVLIAVEIPVAVAALVAVTVRYVVNPLESEGLRPLLCIYTAPPSMCLAGLLTIYPQGWQIPMTVWHIVCCGFYLFALSVMIGCLRLPFYPSYASMTFPFVISATASIKTAACLSFHGVAAPVLHVIASAQMAIATCIVVYVLVRYCMFFIGCAMLERDGSGR